MLKLILTTLALFIAAAFFEVWGGYTIWQWMKKERAWFYGIVGGIALFVYGIIQTFQPSHFGRVYASYGAIFIIFSILWGRIIDKKKPDKQEIIGALVILAGAAIMFYAPR
jgi:small multidrug resistance family-3 protein